MISTVDLAVGASGERRGVVVAVDMGNGAPVALGLIGEEDTSALMRFVEPLCERFDVEVAVIDDLEGLAVGEPSALHPS